MDAALQGAASADNPQFETDLRPDSGKAKKKNNRPGRDNGQAGVKPD
jgi:hypothetical protein